MKKQGVLDDIEKQEKKRYHRRIAYIASLIVFVLIGSTAFYHYVEGWRYLDAMYFSAYTMTTVGYGDFVPKTDFGKAFTIVFMFAGVGIALYGISVLAAHFVEAREDFWLSKMEKLPVPKQTKDFLEVMKGILHYDKDKLVGGVNNYRKRR